MTSLYRSSAICIFCVASAALLASAQSYTQHDFPGALATTLNGGPNRKEKAWGPIPWTASIFMASRSFRPIRSHP